MSELPYVAASQSDGLYSIEQQEQFYSHLIDHQNDYLVSPITNMIDQAANDVSMGLSYLNHHWSPEHGFETIQFFDDALQALLLSKSLSQNGYIASAFLNNVSHEIERARDQLYETQGSTEQVLAQYLEAALQEIQVTKYLETLQGYEEGANRVSQANSSWPEEQQKNETEEDDITIINPS